MSTPQPSATGNPPDHPTAPAAAAGGLRWLWRGPAWLASGVMIVCVRGYQKLIRPMLPPMCRFEPGCSEYFIGAVKKHGPVVGCAKGAWRICRCNPWNKGGWDPP